MSTLASVILEGLDASKPSAGIPGRLYFTTDTDLIYYDTGSAWITVGPQPASGGGGGTTVDILSDQKASGTLFSSKAEYLGVTAGQTITLLSRSSSEAGYVDSIFLAFENETNAQTATLNITVNGDSTPNISVPLEQFFEAVYIAGSGAPNNVFANQFFGANTASAADNGMFTSLPIPYSTGITITLTVPDADTIFYTISGQAGVSNSWPNTRKLWVQSNIFSAPAKNSAETFLNYAGSNPGRFVGTWMLSDGFPNTLSPYGADLEGNFRIYIDCFNSVWAASTPFTTGKTIIDPNGNLQTVTTGGTTGSSAPSSWGITTGATTTDGSVTWTCTVGDPPNIWRASAVYTVGMSILDTNGNVQTVTTAGTSGSSQPTWNTSGTTTDGSVTWTYSPGSSRCKASYQSSGSEDYFLMGFYGGGVPAGFTGNGAIGRTFVNNNPETGSFYRFHLRDPIRFNSAIAVLRQTGDSSEVNFTGTPKVYATTYFYTQDTN